MDGVNGEDGAGIYVADAAGRLGLQAVSVSCAQSRDDDKVDAVRAVDGRKASPDGDGRVELAFADGSGGLLAADAGQWGEEVQRFAGGGLKECLPLHHVQGDEETLEYIGSRGDRSRNGADVPLVVVIRNLGEHIGKDGAVLCVGKVYHAMFTSMLDLTPP